MSRTLPFKIFYPRLKGVFRTHATTKMELFVTLVNGFQSLTNVTKTSILDVAGVLVTILRWFILCFLVVLVNPLLSL